MYRKRNPYGASAAVSILLITILFLFPLLTSGPDTPRNRLPDRSIPADAAEETAAEAVEAEPEAVPVEAEPVPAPTGELDRAVILRVLNNGDVVEMDLGTYLAGVLRGEMPASFEEEALKAQAVAARTYTLRMIRTGGKHGGRADICTNPGCCQAWQSEASSRKGWGNLADMYEEKIETAVRETDGETLLYEGEPILAVFHSSSPGLTQEVGQVWGGEAPYLVPVSSPEHADNVPNYYSRAEFSAERFAAKVRSSYSQADFSGPISGWLRDAERNSAGTVENLTVGGVSMRGAKLRSILGLRSACFTWEVDGDTLVFYVTGFGHGVGLSQYGANQMAADGADYREIVTHYYTGVEIGHWSME